MFDLFGSTLVTRECMAELPRNGAAYQQLRFKARFRLPTKPEMDALRSDPDADEAILSTYFQGFESFPYEACGIDDSDESREKILAESIPIRRAIVTSLLRSVYGKDVLR